MNQDARVPILDYELTMGDIKKLYDHIPKAVKDTLAHLGVPKEYQAPVNSDTGQYFDGKLPANLSRISNTDLGELMYMMNAHMDRISEIEADYHVHMETSKDIAKKLRRKLEKHAKGRTKDSKEIDVDLDRRLAEVEVAAMFYKHVHNGLKRSIDRGNRDLRTISRLITQRETEGGHKYRQASVSQAGGKAWGQNPAGT